MDDYEVLHSLFDNYSIGTLLAVAWEGGGAAGTLATIARGIVRLGGPGIITLGSLQLGIPTGDYVQIRLRDVVAVSRIAALPSIS
ncbi:hypothetical protein ACPUYX_16915 [Desulfosporosinus sp. SYSU MS00001]|uniref:hypothetical protein n=1 Tax=Desulfosporosinus sp. SYSU MS00001 TaxID=3416284 RepID=UPI003CF462D4